MTITIELPVKSLSELWFSSKEELEKYFFEYLYRIKKVKKLQNLIEGIKALKLKDKEKLLSDNEILEILND